MAKTPVISLARISIRGVVQGVGFRPFVYQLAHKHNLRGWVCNTSADVRIEVEGDARDIEAFLRGLKEDTPPMARIEGIAAEAGPPAGYHTFEIRQSIAEVGKYQFVSPDIATCPDCLREIFDPADRRFRYPFTNCTNCGPRFTIIADIPYDRPNTTMSKFRMCPACRQEYDNPLDRRFHAQPNACPVCGPRLELRNAAGGTIRCDDTITTTSKLLKEGNIVAVKGLGGFLLACDATSEDAVNLLRRRKRRPAKPLAVMVASLEEAKLHCYVNQAEAELLSSPASPIVLMKRRHGSNIAAAVVPGLDYLGVMLPYTPLHHLLMRDTGLPLVMTSGNLSEEPIARDNDEALRRLGGIADYFLVHNRGIYARYDDSVLTVAGGSSRFVRRARGYAPHPVRLARDGRQVLACGAEEKNTFCLTRDGFAFISQHIGDMENLETLEHFVNTIELYKKLFRIQPEIVAHDMHPEYLSTKYALELAGKEGLELFPVQHHHAHIAACLADNGIEGPVIGVALDGTGYGSDGNIWGGEFLVADLNSFTRAAQLEYLPLPGGALAIRKPYRTAIGYLLALGLDLDYSLPLFQGIDREEIEIIRGQMSAGFNTPLTSSMGRLFDAVAALTGVRGVIEYEAQAAIDLETVASHEPGETGSYPLSVAGQNGASLIKLGELIAAIIDDLHKNISKPGIAARFHNTIARIVAEVCQAISRRTGLRGVAFSGGVFQNRLLLEQTIARLEAAGLQVYTHHQVPCNDGGVSLGQAAIASFHKEAND